MKLDSMLLVHDLNEMPGHARAAEAIGFDGLWTAETSSDAFLPLTLAAEHSSRVNLGTAIAVAFPRSPTTLAHVAWDLARYSRGRFILGLGSQVRGHIERRYGVKWEKPVARMRETILALRAVWECWQTGAPLNFRGEFFKLTLMTPFFSPGPHDYPQVPIFIAAVNRRMLALAGELCEGVHVHALHSVPYLRQVVIPAVRSGLDAGGRRREDFTVTTSVFVVPTDGAKPASHYEQFVRQQISFYMSTPAYKVVLDVHGWEDVSLKLGKLARRGEWDEMPKLITDEMLDAIAVSGAWAELPHKINQKYGDLLDRVAYYLPFVPGEQDDGWRASVEGFRKGEVRSGK